MLPTSVVTARGDAIVEEYRREFDLGHQAIDADRLSAQGVQEGGEHELPKFHRNLPRWRGPTLTRPGRPERRLRTERNEGRKGRSRARKALTTKAAVEMSAREARRPTRAGHAQLRTTEGPKIKTQSRTMLRALRRMPVHISGRVFPSPWKIAPMVVPAPR
jgi:hypothetical protein